LWALAKMTIRSRKRDTAWSFCGISLILDVSIVNRH
jgi:hypothetical protein